MNIGVYMRVATEEQLMEKALEEFKKDPVTYTLDEVEALFKDRDAFTDDFFSDGRNQGNQEPREELY